MRRLVWCLKQLLPLAYWTRYTNEAGEKRFSIWRMWFGRCFNVVDFPIGENSQQDRDRRMARSLRRELSRASTSH